MKERLSLLEVCRLPDVQLHSKKALFKAIISKEPLASQEMKEQIISLSYTVKTIGVQGEEVGISSKRVPLKLKKKQDYHEPGYVPKANYLPHQTFYSHALIPVKKDKEKSKDDLFGLMVESARNTILIDTDSSYKTQQFKVRAKSTTQMRTVKSLQKGHEENIEEFGLIQGIKRASSAIKKKSFSAMLKECTPKKSDELINPLMHEEYPLFKTIQRIKMAYPTIC
jgi:hypothetical protein